MQSTVQTSPVATIEESPVPRRKRRTQAERTADTRLALIEAAIRLLCRVGYAGTTTIAIPEEAGLTRGAFQHQFGTKAALMIEVVRHVYEGEITQYRSYFANLKTVELSDFPRVIWEIHSRPEAVAVLEILNGCRNDPLLAEELMPIQDEIERNSIENLVRGIQRHIHPPVKLDMKAATHAVRLLVSASRGLSIMMGMGKDRRELDPIIELLEQFLRSGQAEWIKANSKAI